MTPDERNLLQRFLSDLGQARGAAKDPDAERMIADALRANPDGGYRLVQHAMVADQALQAAQAQIAALEGQGQGYAPQGYEPQGSGPQGFGPQGYDAQGYGGAPPVPPPQSPLSQHGGLGGFLKSAGTLAAGVAGGSFLAEGLSNLFSDN